MRAPLVSHLCVEFTAEWPRIIKMPRAIKSNFMQGNEADVVQIFQLISENTIDLVPPTGCCLLDREAHVITLLSARFAIDKPRNKIQSR